MQIKEGDPIVDQMRATIRQCHQTITAWEHDPTQVTPHEARMVQCMTDLASINNQLTERITNA